MANIKQVVIWVLKEDLINNNITEYHTTNNKFKDMYEPNEYVQVMVSLGEFIRMENEPEGYYHNDK
tara:strand:+ start:1735 stop:1932 length:198 start_codon:yes stop_codon:yes gene_type:complete